MRRRRKRSRYEELGELVDRIISGIVGAFIREAFLGVDKIMSFCGNIVCLYRYSCSYHVSSWLHLERVDKREFIYSYIHRIIKSKINRSLARKSGIIYNRKIPEIPRIRLPVLIRNK